VATPQWCEHAIPLPGVVMVRLSNPLLHRLVPFRHKRKSGEWLLLLQVCRNKRSHRRLHMTEPREEQTIGHTHQERGDRR
jgi:hypothetical protein